MADKKDPEKKEPFVPSEDRPEVKIDPDKPITELRVRDLSALLHQGLVAKALKVEIDWPKHHKFEKFEKHEKFEKIEKFEKHEKLEWEKLDKAPIPDISPKLVVEGDPGRFIDPRIDRLITAVSGLAQQVEQLSKDVAKLKEKVGG